MTAPLFLFKLAFEVMACIKVEQQVDIHWMVVFLPLYLLSIVSAVVAGIQLRRDGRNIELEVTFAALFLQFLFIPLKVSYLVAWSWATVFVPVWMLLCLGALVFFYNLAMTIFSIAKNTHTIDDRFGFVWKTVSLALVICPLLTFFVRFWRRFQRRHGCSPMCVLFLRVCCRCALTRRRTPCFWSSRHRFY